MKRLVVIDMSGNTMKVADYEALKASGVDGVILRVGYGSDISQKEDAFNEGYNLAKRSGLLVGGYWFNYFRSVEDARVEAEVFAQAVEGCELDLGLFGDYEEDTIDYMDRSGGSKDDFTSRILAFCDRLKELRPELVAWYSNTSCINGAHGAGALDLERLSKYPLWHAHFNGDENTTETEYNGIRVIGHQFANMDCNPSWINGSPNFDTSIMYYEDEDLYNSTYDGESVEVDNSTSNEENAQDEPTNAFNKGDRVQVINAVTYDGGSFVVYYDAYDVIEASGDRVVIGIDGVVTCAINARDISLVGSSAPTESNSGGSIAQGDTVRVINAEQYNGGSFTVYYDSYTVMELNGDRAVIGVNDVVTCAINVNNIERV